MNEKETLELLKHAIAVDAIEAADLARPAMTDRRLPFRKNRLHWAIGAFTAIAATIAIVVHVTRPVPLIRNFQLDPVAIRGVEGHCHAKITLSEPAYVSMVLVDTRNERWLMHYRGSPGDCVHWMGIDDQMEIPLEPNPKDVRGAARAVYAILLAGLMRDTTPSQILDAIPDPVLPVGAELPEIAEALRKLGAQLERRFNCSVRLEAVP